MTVVQPQLAVLISGVATKASAVTDYYRSYLAVAVFAIAAVGMVAAMLFVGSLLRPKRPQGQKYIAYEAGSDPIGGFGQANVRYYIYALLFVMFDVEAVFIFPWATNLDGKAGLGTFGLVEMIVFIAILALALVYAWRKGVLTWA